MRKAISFLLLFMMLLAIGQLAVVAEDLDDEEDISMDAILNPPTPAPAPGSTPLPTPEPSPSPEPVYQQDGSIEITLTAVGEDPDGDTLSYRWWRYFEADTYNDGVEVPALEDQDVGLVIDRTAPLAEGTVPDSIVLAGADTEQVTFTVPEDAKSDADETVEDRIADAPESAREELWVDLGLRQLEAAAAEPAGGGVAQERKRVVVRDRLVQVYRAPVEEALDPVAHADGMGALLPCAGDDPGEAGVDGGGGPSGLSYEDALGLGHGSPFAGFPEYTARAPTCLALGEKVGQAWADGKVLGQERLPAARTGLRDGRAQLVRLRHVRHGRRVEVVRVQQHRGAKVLPAHAEHEVVEVREQLRGVAAARRHEQRPRPAIAVKLVRLALRKGPQPVEGVLEQAAVRPEEERRRERHHVARAVRRVDGRHVVALCAGSAPPWRQPTQQCMSSVRRSSTCTVLPACRAPCSNERIMAAVKPLARDDPFSTRILAMGFLLPVRAGYSSSASKSAAWPTVFTTSSTQLSRATSWRLWTAM